MESYRAASAAQHVRHTWKLREWHWVGRLLTDQGFPPAGISILALFVKTEGMRERTVPTYDANSCASPSDDKRRHKWECLRVNI